MKKLSKMFSVFCSLMFFGVLWLQDASGVTYEDYKAAVADNHEVQIPGVPQGDGKDLGGRLYQPEGSGPFPALIALHGAGGIFPYQLWWAKEISKKGFVVLFIDSYCTRGYLCVHDTDDNDPRRKKIMQAWQKVSPRQRVMDAVGGYMFLSQKSNVKNDAIGLIGWSWGGSSALFALKVARRFSLPNGGFKGTITFYPNLKHLKGNPQWTRTGPIGQPTLILYGKDDVLESVESYKELMAEENSALVSVVGYAGATRKFDELGDLRTKSHPSAGEFTKAFHSSSFEDAVKKVDEFLVKNYLK